MDLTYVWLALAQLLIFILGGVVCYWFFNTFGKVALQNVMGGNKGIAIMLLKGNKLKFLTGDFNKNTLTYRGKDYAIEEAVRYAVGNVPVIFVNDGNALPIKLELDEQLQAMTVKDKCPSCGVEHEHSFQVQTHYQYKAPSEYLSAIIVKIWALTQSAFFKLNQALLWGTLIISLVSLLGVVYLVLAGVPGAAGDVQSTVVTEVAKLAVTPIPGG